MFASMLNEHYDTHRFLAMAHHQLLPRVALVNEQGPRKLVFVHFDRQFPMIFLPAQIAVANSARASGA
jgi:hypothetical protein